MRLFAIACFALAVYFSYTAVDAMRTGVTTALRGPDKSEQRRDVPDSKYQKFLMARWVLAGGLVAMGVVMQISAARFEKLLDHAPRQ